MGGDLLSYVTRDTFVKAVVYAVPPPPNLFFFLFFFNDKAILTFEVCQKGLQRKYFKYSKILRIYLTKKKWIKMFY